MECSAIWLEIPVRKKNLIFYQYLTESGEVVKKKSVETSIILYKAFAQNSIFGFLSLSLGFTSPPPPPFRSFNL
jgi:hypothetical protein